MAFRIPCKRRCTTPVSPPIYNSFERPRKKFNWGGFHGLWLSVLSLSSAGFLSPFSLLVSLNGMRRKKGPRKFAAAGTLISIAGIALASLIVCSVAHSVYQHQQHLTSRKIARKVAQQRGSAKKLVALAAKELTQYRNRHQGILPSVIDSNMLVIKHRDPWGEELRFDLNQDHGVVRSAGPDMIFETSDDVVIRVDGDIEPLAPLLEL